MSKFPLTLKQHALLNAEQTEGALTEQTEGSALTEPTRNALSAPIWPTIPFFSFHYSVTEISAHGSSAHLKHRETRLQDGRVTSESFEGELDRGAFDQMMDQARARFIEQTELLMRSLTWFLPSSVKPHSERD